MLRAGEGGHDVCVYIYLFGERESESERARERESEMKCIHICVYMYTGDDEHAAGGEARTIYIYTYIHT
jgi:hypothetical protein